MLANKRIIKRYGYLSSIGEIFNFLSFRADDNLVVSFDTLGNLFASIYKYLLGANLIIRFSGFIGPITNRHFLINRFIVENIADKIVVNSFALKKLIQNNFKKCEPLVIYNGINY